MKSPFPGMDPYIETCGLWEDFHTHLIEKIYEALADAVPAKYVVRTAERGYVVLADEKGSEHHHSFKPDVTVTTNQEESSPTDLATAVAEPAVELEPLTMRAFIEEEFRETFVEIYEAGKEDQLVTCIEVLSPSNKKANSPGWDLYQRKRRGLLMGHSANLIEIDLLRAGERQPMLDPWPGSPYTLLVVRKSNIPYCKVWPAHFLRPLPSIPVPLLKPDPDIPLSLQPMIDTIYARSRYCRSIDYTKASSPPLTSAESTWLGQRLQQRDKPS